MSTNVDGSLKFNYDVLCKTDVTESDKFTFVWAISKYSSSVKEKANGESLKSKGFQIVGPGNKITNWHAKLYPNGVRSTEKNYTSVFVCNESSNEVTVKCTFFVIVPPNGDKHEVGKCEMIKVPVSKTFGINRIFHSSTELDRFTQNDTLTLIVEITVLGEKESFVVSNNRNEALSAKYHQNQLSQDLHLLYDTKEYADIMILCGGKTFRGHKNILASRSPVFAAMFKSDMKESNAGSIEIKNMNPEVLESLLEYIYTGSASSVEMLAKELLAAADQYQIGKLKELCELKLCSVIDAGNCIELLVIGDLHQASILKTQALGFISQNLDKINISDCKKTLISYPTLLFEVTELLLPKRKLNDNNSEGVKRARTK